MFIIAGLICVVLIIMALPYMDGKAIFEGLAIMAAVFIGGIILAYIGIPLIIICGILFFLKFVFFPNDKG